MTTITAGQVFPDLIHHEPLVPPGTTLNLYANRGFILDGPGEYRALDRQDHWSTNYYLQPLHWAEGEIKIPPESRAEMAWRIRDTALASAERSGVNINPVLEIARRIGADQPRLGLGGTVANRHDLTSLPAKTVLSYGNLAKNGKFGVWIWNGNVLVRMLGPWERPLDPSPLRIEEGALDVLDPGEPIGDEEAAKLAMLAWRIGRQKKAQVNWCGVFESTLAALGFDDKTVELAKQSPNMVGDELDGPDKIAATPQDTLLAWAFSTGTVALYRRDDTALNSCRTRLVWESRNGNGKNSHPRMRIVKLPDEEMSWTMSPHFAEQLPPKVRLVDNRGNTYTTPCELAYVNYVVTAWPGVTA